MSIARKILENTFVQVIGKLATAGLSVVVLKIITGYLGTSGYGDYTTIYQFLAFFGIIADFGIYTISVKEMSRDSSKIPMILGNVMGLRSFLALIAMILAVISAFLIPGYANTLIPMGILIATITTVINLLNGTISSVLQVHLKMHYATISLVVGKVVSVAYMAFVVYVAFTDDLVNGFYHLLWAGVIGNLVMMMITGYYARRYVQITYRFDYIYWKQIFVTSLPFGVALILNTIYFKLDVLLIGFLLPRTDLVSNQCLYALCSDNEVGLYGVAMKFLEMLLIIPIYFMNSVLPIMTRYIEEQSKKVNQLIQYSFDFLLATALPILIGGFILAVPITRLISDESFLSGVQFDYGSDVAVKILMFALAFSFINALFGFILVVLNHQKRLMYINAIAVIFNLVGNLVTIPIYGFRGAAITSVLSALLILIFSYLATYKLIGFHLGVRTLIRTTFSALMMGLVVYLGFNFIPNVHYGIQLGVLVPIGGLVYIALMFKTKAITSDMVGVLKKRN